MRARRTIEIVYTFLLCIAVSFMLCGDEPTKRLAYLAVGLLIGSYSMVRLMEWSMLRRPVTWLNLLKSILRARIAQRERNGERE